MRHTDALHHASHRFVTRRRRSRHPLAPLMAGLRAPWLNRQLAAGVEPWCSPVHAARARQLTGHRTRRMLARGLERLVEQAEEPPSLSRAAVIHPWRPGVREARPLILTLASRLRGSAPVDPRGIAALKDLLTDGGGPVYSPGDPNTVKRQLEVIDQWLDVHD
jgi:hypothetical protein